MQGNLPAGGGSFDYVRQPGSRSEPAGPCFALMNAPDPLPPPSAPTKRSVKKSMMKKKTNGRAEGDDEDEDEDDEDDGDKDDDDGRAPENNHNDTPGGDDDDDEAGGDGYNYSPLPNDAEAHDKEIGEMDPDKPRYVYSPGLRAAPQDGNKAYLLTSSDYGANWSWALLPDSLQVRMPLPPGWSRALVPDSLQALVPPLAAGGHAPPS